MTAHDPKRRVILRIALGTGCALAVPAVLAAESGRVSKAQAKYQERPKGEQKCGTCLHFLAATSTCKLVEGRVSPEGWCMLWAGKT